ncbi:2OG-Fe(II) oxygenase [Mucilaginibacter sp. UC70_90]
MTPVQPLKDRIKNLHWDQINKTLHNKGFVIVKQILDKAACNALINDYNADEYRKTVNMERYRFGYGEYKYYKYPLPAIITDLRESVYPYIVPVANKWMNELGFDKQFPGTHEEMKQLNHEAGQTKPTALILQYTEGGFNTLHQDLYGEGYFPIQMVFMLDQHNRDYTGGEFVITEQIPRAQSKVNVLTPGMGDMVLFTTNFRPVKGSKGYYRVNMKHGVSPVHSGKRHSLGIIFHDALS